MPRFHHVDVCRVNTPRRVVWPPRSILGADSLGPGTETRRAGCYRDAASKVMTLVTFVYVFDRRGWGRREACGRGCDANARHVRGTRRSKHDVARVRQMGSYTCDLTFGSRGRGEGRTGRVKGLVPFQRRASLGRRQNYTLYEQYYLPVYGVSTRMRLRLNWTSAHPEMTENLSYDIARGLARRRRLIVDG